jgi:hypothetical protein
MFFSCFEWELRLVPGGVGSRWLTGGHATSSTFRFTAFPVRRTGVNSGVRTAG